MKFGLVGASGRGMFLAKLAMDESDENKLTAVADPSEASRAKCVEIFKGHGSVPACYASEAEMLEKEKDLDGVFIGSSDCHHYLNLMKTLEFPISVYCEKPMVQRIDECKDVLRAWKKNKNVLCCGLEMRHSPLFGQIKEILASGKIGKPFMINAYEGVPGGGMHQNPLYRKKETGRSLLLQKGVHDIDLVNWFVDDRPVSVCALGGLNCFGPDNKPAGYSFDEENAKRIFVAPYHNNYKFEYQLADPYGDGVNMEDNYTCLIDYANNARASFTLCYNSPVYIHEFNIIGTKGKISATYRHKCNTAEIRLMTCEDPENEYVIHPPLVGGHGGGDAAIVAAFIDSIKTGEQPLADIYAGYWSSIVGAAAQDSIEEKKIINIGEPKA